MTASRIMTGQLVISVFVNTLLYGTVAIVSATHRLFTQNGWATWTARLVALSWTATPAASCSRRCQRTGHKTGRFARRRSTVGAVTADPSSPPP